MAINLFGLLCSLLAVLWLKTAGQAISLPQYGLLITALALAIPIIVMEWYFLKPYLNPSAGLLFEWPRFRASGCIKRTVTKLIGLYVCFAFVAFIYWIFPEYRGGYYAPFFELATTVVGYLALLAWPYFYLMDRLMIKPKDSYWALGAGLFGQGKLSDWPDIVQLLLGWTVKLFFLPLMFTYASNNLTLLVQYDFSTLFNFDEAWQAGRSLDLYQFFNNLLFYIDLLFVTVGYCFTVRLFDSHIRSTEPTFFGWAIALICYQPFWGAVFGSLYISYNAGRDWSNFFWDWPVVHLGYGMLILSLVTIYVWASMAFGIRFSNLTHRGIITNGPFRYCKHPAYVSKNLSWWLIFMPFLVAPEFDDKLRLSLLLLLQNGVYFLRARTEEKHLSRDPRYVAYAAYIERHGMFAWLGRLWPILRFKAGHLLNWPNAMNQFELNLNQGKIESNFKRDA